MEQVTKEMVQGFQRELDNMEDAGVVRRAVMNQGINAVSEDPMVKAKLNRAFSIDIPTGKVSAQQKSGRCWLFATLNTLRHDFAKEYKVKDFEFSQNYLSFWDRFEKANAFYERIIETASLPLEDRRFQMLLQMPDDDGGQFANAVALIQKYGLVPKYVMPETQASNHTDEFSKVLSKRLRKDAMLLRRAVENGESMEDIQELKKERLATVYQMCVYAFGEPVQEFDFEYVDDDQKFHQDLGLTPQTFYEKYVSRQLDDYVVISHAPDRPYYQQYNMPDEDNIIGGPSVTFLNVPLDVFKKTLLMQLKDGVTTWFACDVLQQMSREEGLLDAELYRHGELFNTDLNFTKEERFCYREACMSHAMTFTGVNLVEDKPVRWKVENSWGDKIGDKGYFVMDDNWFDEYVYEIVVDKKYLTDKMKQALTTTPVHLDLWDVMA